MYFDEDMILDIRMNMLSKYVKKFVIIESKFLHSGKPKKLNFDIKNFSKFKDKINYIVMEKPPNGIEKINDHDNENERNRKILDNSLNRENSQRNRLWSGIEDVDDEDLILSSDLDEIPNLKNFKYKNKINIFVQKVFYYKFNLQQPNFTWFGTRACKKKNLVSFQWLRINSSSISGNFCFNSGMLKILSFIRLIDFSAEFGNLLSLFCLIVYQSGSIEE